MFKEDQSSKAHPTIKNANEIIYIKKRTEIKEVLNASCFSGPKTNSDASHFSSGGTFDRLLTVHK